MTDEPISLTPGQWVIRHNWSDGCMVGLVVKVTAAQAQVREVPWHKPGSAPEPRPRRWTRDQIVWTFPTQEAAEAASVAAKAAFDSFASEITAAQRVLNDATDRRRAAKIATMRGESQ